MILFFDTETTGIRKDGYTPRIVQIGAIQAEQVDGDIIIRNELNVLIDREQFQVPFAASEVHGITDAVLDKYGVNRVVALHLFFNMVRSSKRLVAHNMPFDLDMLDIELQELGPKLKADRVAEFKVLLEDIEKVDTMDLSRDVVRAPLTEKQKAYFEWKGIKPEHEFKNPNLSETYRHFFDNDFDGAHNAMADVRACIDIYSELEKRGL